MLQLVDCTNLRDALDAHVLAVSAGVHIDVRTDVDVYFGDRSRHVTRALFVTMSNMRGISVI